MVLTLLAYVLLSGTLLYAFYKWATQNKCYFVKRKMKYLEPRFLIGNTTGLFLNQYTPANFVDSIYSRFPSEKLVGFFDMREPVYMACDVEFIRRITTRDFDYFEDHVIFMDSDSDTLLGKSLFMLDGKKWRDMRATLSPAFTGSKMRLMFDLVTECADDMAKYFIAEAKSDKPIQWEMKKLFSRYTSDMIASCAFGLKANSLKDPTNEFFTIGTESLNFASVKVGLRMLLIRTLPKLMRAIDFEFFPLYVKKFFKSMVLDTMEVREKESIFRPDMINILMQVRKGIFSYRVEETKYDDTGFATVQESNIGKVQVNRSWTDDEIVAQCFIFFAAGFDTVSTLLSFAFYELAINPDIQQKVYEEVAEVNGTLNGARLTYDSLSKLKYLDQVISETLRKWSPTIFTTRKCSKDYEFELNGNNILIERNKTLWIPIHSIHHDPQFWHNPKKFDPDRFSDENKDKIVPGSFIAFGIGPRACIGSRFALMEIKALFFYLLLNFSIHPYAETQIPLKIRNSPVNWATEKGINLELKPRT